MTVFLREFNYKISTQNFFDPNEIKLKDKRDILNIYLALNIIKPEFNDKYIINKEYSEQFGMLNNIKDSKFDFFIFSLLITSKIKYFSEKYSRNEFTELFGNSSQTVLKILFSGIY